MKIWILGIICLELLTGKTYGSPSTKLGIENSQTYLVRSNYIQQVMNDIEIQRQEIRSEEITLDDIVEIFKKIQFAQIRIIFKTRKDNLSDKEADQLAHQYIESLPFDSLIKELHSNCNDNSCHDSLIDNVTRQLEETKNYGNGMITMFSNTSEQLKMAEFVKNERPNLLNHAKAAINGTYHGYLSYSIGNETKQRLDLTIVLARELKEYLLNLGVSEPVLNSVFEFYF